MRLYHAPLLEDDTDKIFINKSLLIFGILFFVHIYY